MDEVEIEHLLRQLAEAEFGKGLLDYVLTLPAPIREYLARQELRKRHGGRPRGPVYDYRAALARMADLIVADPDLSVRQAAIHAAKAFSFGPDVLRKRFQENKAELIDAARERRDSVAQVEASPPPAPMVQQPQWTEGAALPARALTPAEEAMRQYLSLPEAVRRQTLQRAQDSIDAQKAIVAESVAAVKRQYEEAARILDLAGLRSSLVQAEEVARRTRREIEEKFKSASTSTLYLIRDYKP